MNRKTIWLLSACLLSAMFVLCAVAGPTRQHPPPTRPRVPHNRRYHCSTTASDKPEYGGIITRMLASDSAFSNRVTQDSLSAPPAPRSLTRSGFLSTG